MERCSFSFSDFPRSSQVLYLELADTTRYCEAVHHVGYGSGVKKHGSGHGKGEGEEGPDSKCV